MKTFVRFFCKVLFVLSMCMLIGVSTLSALEKPSFDVMLSVDGSKLQKISTKVGTVRELLDEQGITVGEFDVVAPPLDRPIAVGSVIYYHSSVDIDLFIDNNPAFTKTGLNTVGEFVEYYEMRTGVDYSYDESTADDLITKDHRILLYTRSTQTVTEEEIIPFETVYVDSADVETETVLTEGADGLRVVKTVITFENREEIGREVISDEITIQPVDKVIALPIPKPEPEPIVEAAPPVVQEAPPATANTIEGYEYTEMITMEATAYTLSPLCVPTQPGDPGYGLTASGMKAQVGVVAVDTDYIPFGTEMYIEGYGYAVAGDTGGAIDGYSVDLFFNTLDECYQFGRQDVDVYILKQD